jgi:hypothetical protein
MFMWRSGIPWTACEADRRQAFFSNGPTFAQGSTPT